MTRTVSKTLKIPLLIALAWSTSACISASAPKSEADLIGEAMYAPQPWVHSTPVNITARVSAIQGALSAVQSASNSYVQYQVAQADTFNRRQARKAALKSQQYYARLKAEEDRLRAIRESEATMRPVGKVAPISIVVGPAPTMADYADEIGDAAMGYAKSMRGWIAAGHPAYEYSSDYKAPAPKPRVKKKK